MIIKKSESEENVIEMYHQYDYKPIQIKTSTTKKMENLIKQIEEYGKSTKFDSSNSFTPIGKLVIYGKSFSFTSSVIVVLFKNDK